MTYQKLKWQAKGIRSAFWGYFAFPVLLLDFSFRWKSELKFLQVSHISSTILTSLRILLLGQNMLICFWMEINSSLAFWAHDSQFTRNANRYLLICRLQLTFFTQFPSLVSWRTRALEVVVFTQSDTLASVLTRALVTRSLQQAH